MSMTTAVTPKSVVLVSVSGESMWVGTTGPALLIRWGCKGGQERPTHKTAAPSKGKTDAVQPSTRLCAAGPPPADAGAATPAGLACVVSISPPRHPTHPPAPTSLIRLVRRVACDRLDNGHVVVLVLRAQVGLASQAPCGRVQDLIPKEAFRATAPPYLAVARYLASPRICGFAPGCACGRVRREGAARPIMKHAAALHTMPPLLRTTGPTSAHMSSTSQQAVLGRVQVFWARGLQADSGVMPQLRLT